MLMWQDDYISTAKFINACSYNNPIHTADRHVMQHVSI